MAQLTSAQMAAAFGGQQEQSVSLPRYSKDVEFTISDARADHPWEVSSLLEVRATHGKGMDRYTVVKKCRANDLHRAMSACLDDLAKYIGNKAVRP